jgi:FMN phosphatase YigB (HAD superfamily)
MKQQQQQQQQQQFIGARGAGGSEDSVFARLERGELQPGPAAFEELAMQMNSTAAAERFLHLRARKRLLEPPHSEDTQARVWAEKGCDQLTAVRRAVAIARIDAKAVERLFQGLADAVSRPVPDLLAVVQDAHAAGLKIGALTNDIGGLQQQQQQQHFGFSFLQDLPFAAVVRSSLAGTRKPEPSAYEAILKALEVDAEKTTTVFVDDLEPNCRAAARAGLEPFLVDNTRQSPAAIAAALRIKLGLPPAGRQSMMDGTGTNKGNTNRGTPGAEDVGSLGRRGRVHVSTNPGYIPVLSMAAL